MKYVAETFCRFPATTVAAVDAFREEMVSIKLATSKFVVNLGRPKARFEVLIEMGILKSLQWGDDETIGEEWTFKADKRVRRRREEVVDWYFMVVV